MRAALALLASLGLFVLASCAPAAAIPVATGQDGSAPILPAALPVHLDPGVAKNTTATLEGLVRLQAGVELDLAASTPDAPAAAPNAGEPAPRIPAVEPDATTPTKAASRPAAPAPSLDLGEMAEVATLLAAAAWLLGRLLRGEGWRGLPLAALFTRLRADRLLDNKVRARVHEAVQRHPGSSIEQVRADTGIARTTATHHLRRLERHGLVTTVQQGARRRYFVASTAAVGAAAALGSAFNIGAAPPARLRDAAALSHPTARGVASFLLARPGVDQRQVCDALSIRNPNASKHLSKFEDLGLVVTERRGRNRHYFPTDGLRLAMEVLVPAVQPTLPTLVPPMRPAGSSSVPASPASAIAGPSVLASPPSPASLAVAPPEQVPPAASA